MEKRKTGPVLLDPWAPGDRLPLDGWLERQRFAPLWMGLLALAGGWVLFQIAGGLAMVAFLTMGPGGAMEQLAGDSTALLAANAQELLLANTFGQVVGLALPALVLAVLHTSRPRSFLRMRSVSPIMLGGALLGLVVLTPVVQWLGAVNQSVPLPDWLRAFEASQLRLIEEVLGSGSGVIFNVVVLALVPAFCEELLFRGYAQRQFERRLGPAGGIVLCGVLFGLYHVRLSQVLPLTVLGLYLAYLVWRTGSLWPAILVHFANNAFSVLYAELAAAPGGMDASQIETMQIPWYMVGAGAVSFALIIWALHRRGRKVVQRE